MCAKNQSLVFYNYLFLLLCFMPLCAFSQAAHQQQERMFLITESELEIIEEYRLNSEREKQSWLSQVQNLRARAERLERGSSSLNSQLSQAREQNRSLEKYYNESEQEKLILLSLKNGEIAELKLEAAQMERIAADEKIKSQRRLFINIALAGIIFVYCGIKIYFFIKLRK